MKMFSYKNLLMFNMIKISFFLMIFIACNTSANSVEYQLSTENINYKQSGFRVDISKISRLKIFWNTPDNNGILDVDVIDDNDCDDKFATIYIENFDDEDSAETIDFNPTSTSPLHWAGRKVECLDLNDGDKSDDIRVDIESGTTNDGIEILYLPGSSGPRYLLRVDEIWETQQLDPEHAFLGCVADDDGVDGTDDKYVYATLRNDNKGEYLAIVISEGSGPFEEEYCH